MHLTGLANVCIDNPTGVSREALADSVLNYLDTDTLLFFSEDNEELLQRQEATWKPIIEWFCERHKVQLSPTRSAAVTSQPDFGDGAREAVKRYLVSFCPEALQGFSFGADAVKSVLLMCAVVDKQLTVEEAVSLGRLELKVQTERWGNVEWAHDLEMHDTTARLAAAAMFMQLNTTAHQLSEKEALQ